MMIGLETDPAAAVQSPGSAEIAAEAWRADLVDECHVYVAPMLVGGGQRLFPDGVRQPLTLVAEHRFGNGMVHLHYRVGRD